MIKIILSLIFFVLGFVFKLDFPILFLISYLIIGYEVVIGAIKNVLKGEIFDELFLMSVATIGAMCIGKYEEAVFVMIFYEIGEMFAEMAESKSKKSIEKLMELKPEIARVKKGEEYIEVSPEEVKIDDILLVKPGEKIPLDAVVLTGTSFVDNSMLTGESLPYEVGEGLEVFGGTINKTGVIEIKVTKEYKEAAVNKIIDMVSNAESKKAKTEKFITKFSKVYTPLVLIGALIIVLVHLFINDLSGGVYKALVFLVVSCPCALVVSIPLSFFGGIGKAAKSGILVKGGSALETITKVNTIVFDKTGTLTHGVFEVSEIYPEDKKEEILNLAVHTENFSNHPIACSLKKAYLGKIVEDDVTDVEELSGFGIKAKVKGKEVVLGNEKLMNKLDIDFVKPKSFGTVVHLAVDGNYLGYINISDKIKEEAKHVVNKLSINRTIMLTGDNAEIARKVAEQIGVDEVRSELLPEDKIKEIEIMMVDKNKVMFVGDGINDAPAIVRADVGVSMGALGSDAAIEASDVVIMGDNLEKILDLLKIAKKTMAIVKENITMILLVKFLVLLLSAFGLVSMWAAVFADVGVLVIAVLNSLRTLK
ncbi:MAG: cadmium-translocating P-type ATPase [Clostridia bacterium]|nr:cadmium-translocating P-type ATPase [Clostridia bacterium]